MIERSTTIVLYDKEYAVNKYTGTLSGELIVVLAQKLGRPLMGLILNAMEEELDVRTLLPAILDAVDRFDRKEVAPLLMEIFTGTQIKSDGKFRDIIFDIEFEDDVLLPYELAVKVIQFQFKSLQKKIGIFTIIPGITKPETAATD